MAKARESEDDDLVAGSDLVHYRTARLAAAAPSNSAASNSARASTSLDEIISPALAGMFRRPQRIGKRSGWWAHVPFASWIVPACEPCLLVELGTHHGVSYSAFCEGVVHGALPTRCYAIDHWQGDPHAGEVGDSVYEEVVQFNEVRYGTFSELIRCDFDQAVEQFADGSIDLLHIDGYHSYEAVRHDYEVWKPKLSAKSVLLLHDTNVRRDGFGVHRLFKEFQDKFATFEFLHGHGLGVIAHGPGTPAAVARLCSADGASIYAIRERFAQLGGTWSALAREDEARASFQQQSAGLPRQSAEMFAATQQQLGELGRQRDMAQGEATALKNRLNNVLTERDALIARQGEMQGSHLAQKQALQTERDMLSKQLREATARSTDLEGAHRAEQGALRKERDHLVEQARTMQLQHDALDRQQRDARQRESSALQRLESALGERSELKAACDRLQHQARESAASIGQMMASLLQRHEEIIGPRTVGDALPGYPSPRRTPTPKQYPALLNWLKPALRRWRATHDPVARIVRQSILFDARWYASHYSDVARSGLDAAYHFAAFGGAEGRDPSPWFSTSEYLRQNEDVARLDINALYHYEVFGRKQGRPFANPLASAAASSPTNPKIGSLQIKQDFREQSEVGLDRFLASNDRLRLPASARPAVSIVLVLHNQAALTLRCLEALRDCCDIDVEIIVVDNASSDRTPAMMKKVDGCRLVFESENLHFLRGANRGAREAKGKQLLFLNNDALVRPGALSAACRLLESQADIGAIGAKIVLLDGTLQEAGSIIWRDGSCLGYGRGENPADPAFAFRRDVDYCSGAFLMVRRELFEALDGFDPAFAPAYYEDTDLCMRLRAAGHRIVYEPMAEILHFEFGSATSTEAATSLMQDHRALFAQRHAVALSQQHWPHGESMLLSRMRPHAGERVLVIDDRIPIPSLGGGNPRACRLLHGLHGAGAFITHFPTNFPDFDVTTVWRDLPPEVEFIAGKDRPSLTEFLCSRVGYYSTVLVSRPHNMITFRDCCREVPALLASTQVIYDAEAIFAARESARQALQGAHASPPHPTSMSLETEMRLARSASIVLAVSEAEAQSFRNEGCADVRVLGHALAPNALGGDFASRRDFLFVGRLEEDDSPNADSIRWFVQQVMPELDRLIGTDYQLRVVGSCAPRLRAQLESPRVRFHGRVGDLDEAYASARAFVAPTRFAAGIAHKVHEAASKGLPVVSSLLIARQVDWRHGIELLCADTREGFAEACAGVYTNSGKWDRLRQAALARVAQECDPRRFQATINGLLKMEHGQDQLDLAQSASPPPDPSKEQTVATWSVPPEQRAQSDGLFWMAHPMVAARLNVKASGDAARNDYDHLMDVLESAGWRFPVQHVASLGCGFGALERGLAKLGIANSIDGFDLAEGAIIEARRLASELGLSGLRYQVADLEREDLPEVGYDMVFASHSVHHIAGLDRLFSSVRRALRPGGVFHLQEYVGADRFQWPDAQVEGMNEFLDSLPARYRQLPSGVERGHLRRPTVEEVVAVDPSEAVCSSVIVDAVRRHFRIQELRELGGGLLSIGLSGIAHNFDANNPTDAAHMERFFQLEDRLMAEGRIVSDFVSIIAVRD
ncbi:MULTISPECIES: class I SAM-dependent methyltransferase [unclassified Variovorax]|uniref:class I SAM-dependent methyltransferase n=1 Tax=unclassified Variovorax TaxID=663243 RepID=UPI001BD2ACFB|nr:MULTISPECIES: class I SAM-dependent methyltransferase [unclassified Variovorax]